MRKQVFEDWLPNDEKYQFPQTYIFLNFALSCIFMKTVFGTEISFLKEGAKIFPL